MSRSGHGDSTAAANSQPIRFAARRLLKHFSRSLFFRPMTFRSANRRPEHFVEILEDRTVPTTPAVVGFALFNDDGTSHTDGITSDPTLMGTIEADPVGNLPMVEFDFNGDGNVDATTAAQVDFRFRYRPTNLALGAKQVYARARQWNNVQHSAVAGAWESLSFTLVAPPAPSIIAEIALFRDTGTSATDRVTNDPRLVGHLTHNVDSFYLLVQFDYDSNGTVDASTNADLSNDFYFDPTGIGLGSKAIKVRGGYHDSATSTDVFGAWTSLTFTIVANAAPSIGNLQLVRDTGVSNTDAITYDPRIRGTLTDDEAIGSQVVELDTNGDNVVDSTTQAAADGTFSFSPAVAFGDRTLRVRGRSHDDYQNADVVGSWSTIVVHYFAPVGPAISSFTLANDNGESTTDGSTSDPATHGQISGGTAAAFSRIEFDHNGDGIVDGSTIADRTGNFDYLPADLANGSRTLRARSVVYNADLNASFPGSWQSLAFTLIANAAPTISQFSLVNDNGSSTTDGVTSDARLRGQVGNADGPASFVRIEFDHNNDGLVDGSTSADNGGAFYYQPVGVAAGANSIRARAVERDNYRGGDVVGSWTAVAFNFTPTPIPVAEDLAKAGARLAVGVAVDRFDADNGGSTTTAVLDRLAIGSFTPTQTAFDGHAFVPGIGYGQTLQYYLIAVEEEIMQTGPSPTVRADGGTPNGQYTLVGNWTSQSNVGFFLPIGSPGSTTWNYSANYIIDFDYTYTETGVAPNSYQITVTGTYHLEISASGTCSSGNLAILTGNYSIAESDQSTFDYADSGSYSAAALTGVWTFDQTGTRGWTYSEDGSLATNSVTGDYEYAETQTSSTAYADAGSFVGIEQFAGSSYSYGRRIPATTTAGPNNGTFEIGIESDLDLDRQGSGTFQRQSSGLTFNATESLELSTHWQIDREIDATYARPGLTAGTETGAWHAEATVGGFFTLADDRAFTAATSSGDFEYTLTENSDATFDDAGIFVDGPSHGTYIYGVVATTDFFDHEVGDYSSTGTTTAGSGEYEITSSQSVDATAELTRHDVEGVSPNLSVTDWELSAAVSWSSEVSQEGVYDNPTGAAGDLTATVEVNLGSTYSDETTYEAEGTQQPGAVAFTLTASSANSLDYQTDGVVEIAGAASTYVGDYSVATSHDDELTYASEGGLADETITGSYEAVYDEANHLSYSDEANVVVVSNGTTEPTVAITGGELHMEIVATSDSSIFYEGTVTASGDKFEVHDSEQDSLHLVVDGTHHATAGVDSTTVHAVTDLSASRQTYSEIGGDFTTATSEGEYSALDSTYSLLGLHDISDSVFVGETATTTGDYTMSLDAGTSTSYHEDADFDNSATDGSSGSYVVTLSGSSTFALDDAGEYEVDAAGVYESEGAAEVHVGGTAGSAYFETTERHTAAVDSNSTNSMSSFSTLTLVVEEDYKESEGSRTATATTETDLTAESTVASSESGTIETATTIDHFAVTQSADAEIEYSDHGGFEQTLSGEIEYEPTTFTLDIVAESGVVQSGNGSFTDGSTTGTFSYNRFDTAKSVISESGVVQPDGTASGHRTTEYTTESEFHYIETGSSRTYGDGGQTLIAWMNYGRHDDTEEHEHFDSDTDYVGAHESGTSSVATSANEDHNVSGTGGFLQTGRPPYHYSFHSPKTRVASYSADAEFDDDEIEGTFTVSDVTNEHPTEAGGWSMTFDFGDPDSDDPLPPTEENPPAHLYGWGSTTKTEIYDHHVDAVTTIQGAGAFNETGSLAPVTYTTTIVDKAQFDFINSYESTTGSLVWDDSAGVWMDYAENQFFGEYHLTEVVEYTTNQTVSSQSVLGVPTTTSNLTYQEKFERTQKTDGDSTTTGGGETHNATSAATTKQTEKFIFTESTVAVAALAVGTWNRTLVSELKFHSVDTNDGNPVPHDLETTETSLRSGVFARTQRPDGTAGPGFEFTTHAIDTATQTASDSIANMLEEQAQQQAQEEAEEGARAAEEKLTTWGDLGRHGASLGVGAIPIVGDIKDVQEVVTGVDLITGERLSGFDRALTAGAAVIPIVSGAAMRNGKKAVVGAGKAVWNGAKAVGSKIAGWFGKKTPKVLKAADAVHCFPVGTLVATAGGLQPIEELMPYSRVWSFNHRDDCWELCEIVAHHGDDYDDDLVLVCAGGDTIESTSLHPFWVMSGAELEARPRPDHIAAFELESQVPGRWVDARDLRPGDMLNLRNGSPIAIDVVEIKRAKTRVYNFQVERLHNYAVGVYGILVHNNATCNFVPIEALTHPRGTWLKVKESMSPRARAYQQQITGRTGEAFLLDGVRFDGTIGKFLVDAKGPGYKNFVKDGFFRKWFRGNRTLVDQARRQIVAANGTPIAWHFAEEKAAGATRKLFMDNGLSGISIFHTPVR